MQFLSYLCFRARASRLPTPPLNDTTDSNPHLRIGISRSTPLVAVHDAGVINSIAYGG
jgi:hypothetical protein